MEVPEVPEVLRIGRVLHLASENLEHPRDREHVLAVESLVGVAEECVLDVVSMAHDQKHHVHALEAGVLQVR